MEHCHVGISCHFLFFRPWSFPGAPPSVPAGCPYLMFLGIPPTQQPGQLPLPRTALQRGHLLIQGYLLCVYLRICLPDLFLQMLSHGQHALSSLSVRPSSWAFCVAQDPRSHGELVEHAGFAAAWVLWLWLPSWWAQYPLVHVLGFFLCSSTPQGSSWVKPMKDSMGLQERSPGPVAVCSRCHPRLLWAPLE